jgi:hypothetical protein
MKEGKREEMSYLLVARRRLRKIRRGMRHKKRNNLGVSIRCSLSLSASWQSEGVIQQRRVDHSPHALSTEGNELK